jgi:hypothetical protein
MKHSTLKAPAHLRPDTKAWWLHLHSNWRLEAHHSRLLEMACDAWDRYHEAREIPADRRPNDDIGGVCRVAHWLDPAVLSMHLQKAVRDSREC